MERRLTIRCTSCGTLNRVPHEKIGQNARCGSCGAGIDTSGWSDRPVDVTDSSFDAVVRSSARPVLVEFWSPTCGHCLRMAPVLDELALELTGRVVVAKLDVTRNPRTSSLYEIRGTPAFVLIKGGQVAARTVGALDKAELVRRVRPYI